MEYVESEWIHEAPRLHLHERHIYHLPDRIECDDLSELFQYYR